MTIYYVDPVSGSDTNSGSNIGATKANGTGAATDTGVATVDLSADSPDLAGSGVTGGMTIRLNGRTDGVGGSDIFVITDVDLAFTDSVEVSPTPTSTTSGVTWLIGGAFAKTQRALDVAIAGDEVRLCKTGTETTAVQIDVDTNSGSTTGFIHVASYNSTGTAREDGYTIQATSSITGILVFSTQYVVFYGINFDANANATHCWYASTDSGHSHRSINCNFYNANSHGIYVRGNGTTWFFIGGSSHDNGGHGIGSSGVNRGSFYLKCVSLYNNGSDGIGSQIQLCVLENCAIYNNTGSGFHAGQYADLSRVVNCTIYGNGGSGVVITSGQTLINLINNSIVNNVGNAVSVSGSEVYLAVSNHVYNNGSDTLVAYDTIGGDPLFADAANGDFTPLTGSPLIGAGINGSNIGAAVHAAGGSGGGAAILQGTILRG